MTPIAWIDYLRGIDTPTLVNAIELLHIRPNREGFTPLQIRCLFPDLGRMCGYAVTAQVETCTQCEAFELDRFVELYQCVEASPKPAVIALQEIGGHSDYAAHCGEVMATFFTRLGAVGLVSDCGVRDMPEVRRLGFHYFARGCVASHGNYRIARPGVPVQILGLVVKPGDILHGDENGLISVPAGIEDRLPEAVETVRQRERKVMEYVRGNDFALSNFKKMVVE